MADRPRVGDLYIGAMEGYTCRPMMYVYEDCLLSLKKASKMSPGTVIHTCGISNFTDSFFADQAISHHNTFTSLTDSSSSLPSLNSSTELAGPTAMSSPVSRKQIQHQPSKQLKLLNINTQSINNKKSRSS